MPRIALLIEYNGKRFCGSQYQVGVRTVQGELEAALAKFSGQAIGAVFSGRTDSGVHARGQVAHLDWMEPGADLWRLAWGLNGILADDMAVLSAQFVPDAFHARYSATEREYVYRILNRPQRSALLKDTHHFVPAVLDADSMSRACHFLPGEHDFRAFKSTNSDPVTSVCRVARAELLSLSESVLEFWISANHFVYNMVRIIVGTLLEIGLGKRKPESIQDALVLGERGLAGPTAPASGLCLNSVQYPDRYGLFASSSSRHVRSVNGPEI